MEEADAARASAPEPGSDPHHREGFSLAENPAYTHGRGTVAVSLVPLRVQ